MPSLGVKRFHFLPRASLCLGEGPPHESPAMKERPSIFVSSWRSRERLCWLTCKKIHVNGFHGKTGRQGKWYEVRTGREVIFGGLSRSTTLSKWLWQVFGAFSGPRLAKLSCTVEVPCSVRGTQKLIEVWMLDSWILWPPLQLRCQCGLLLEEEASFQYLQLHCYSLPNSDFTASLAF